MLLKMGVKAELKLFELNLWGRTGSCFPRLPLPSPRLDIEFKCLAVCVWEGQLFGLRTPWMIEITESFEFVKLCWHNAD